MNLEISAKMKEEGFLIDWAEKVHYNMELSGDQKDCSEALDAWARKIGERGTDKDNEIAELIRKTITNDVVNAPDELISLAFDESSIGEFDDVAFQVEPKNTINVQEAVPGGNVDASYIDFSYVAPKWTNLQAETFIKYSALRRGGYKTVASMLNYIREAFIQKRWSILFNQMAAAITSGNPNFIGDVADFISEESIDAMAAYLMDVVDAGETPVMLMQNKYMLGISRYAAYVGLTSQEAKELWRRYGSIGMYAGIELRGFSGIKTMADGNLIIPNNTIVGIAGKIGSAVTRGETHVYETMDNNAEHVHLKVGGFAFGTCINKPEKVAKIIIGGK